MTGSLIAIRLDELLGSGPEPRVAADVIERCLQRLVAEAWSALIESCMAEFVGRPAEVLRAATLELPGTESLLPRLAAALGPAMLLGLAARDTDLDAGRMTTLLLAHPSPHHREQALDALQQEPDTTTLPAICAAWARRMLVATLGSMDGLTQLDRLALQERLLALRRPANGAPGGWVEPGLNDGPGDPGHDPANSLGDALLAASHRRASEILARRAGVPPSVVEAAITRRDRQALLALCRAAGAGPGEALALQIQLARICPKDASGPAASGPAGAWRIEALRESRPGRRPGPAGA